MILTIIKKDLDIHTLKSCLKLTMNKAKRRRMLLKLSRKVAAFKVNYNANRNLSALKLQGLKPQHFMYFR